MSQTKDYRLGIDKTIVKTYIPSDCKFHTDLHTHMNGNLPPDVLIALAIVHQIRYPYYYIKKLGLKCTPEQVAGLEARRMAAEHDLLVVGSWIVREGGRCYNRMHWVRPDGSYGTYDKAHTFRPSGEHEVIACGTQKELGDKPLFIVPVGIDYDDYEDVYHNVCLNIGKPIDVRPFMAEYDTNEPVVFHQMREALAEALGSQMHNVSSRDHYEDEYAYCHLKTQETLKALRLKNDPWGRFMARKHISEQIAQMTEEERAPLYAEGAAFAADLKRRGVPLWFASKGWNWGKGLLSLLTVALTVWAIVPIWNYWLLSNLIVYLPTHLITKSKIKDPQFRSSVNFGIRLFATFLYMIVAFVVFLCTKGLWVALGVLALGIASIHVTPRLLMLLRDVWYGMK
jgi:hypothetical protein